MSDLSDRMGDSELQRRQDGIKELRQQFPNCSYAEVVELYDERLKRQAEDLSTEGEAGQSATESQAARGEAADGQPLLGRQAGGVAPELQDDVIPLKVYLRPVVAQTLLRSLDGTRKMLERLGIGSHVELDEAAEKLRDAFVVQAREEAERPRRR